MSVCQVFKREPFLKDRRDNLTGVSVPILSLKMNRLIKTGSGEPTPLLFLNIFLQCCSGCWVGCYFDTSASY